MDKTPAKVTVALDGRVTIEYDDGKTVYLDVEADSLVMRLHLGLDQIVDSAVRSGEQQGTADHTVP